MHLYGVDGNMDNSLGAGFKIPGTISGMVGTIPLTPLSQDFKQRLLTVDPTLKLYLFGTPGQERFGFMWDDIVEGAVGGLVIVDTRRLDDCYAAVDYFEHKQIPFAVAVNAFDGKVEHTLDEVRWALDVNDRVPVIVFDARERGSVRDALLVVLEQALARSEG